MKRAAWGALAIASLTAAALTAGDDGVARAQPLPRPPRVRPSRPSTVVVPAPPVDAGTAFRTHFGIDLATNLIRSDDPDERLRGIERAAALGGPEARVLLAQALAAPPPADARGNAPDPLLGAARRDGRALVAATRGLAHELLEEARTQKLPTAILPVPLAPNAKGNGASADGGAAPALEAGRPDGARALALVGTLLGLFASVDPAQPDLERLARGIAARAVALSGDPHGIEALVAQARGDDAAHGVAYAALRARAARASVVEWLAPPLLSPPVVAIAGEVGDLRAAEPLFGATRSADARLREEAIIALGRIGAPRTADAARAMLRDADPRVRAGAASALVAVGAAEAVPVVAALLADDTTRERGVGLAADVESAEIDRALYDIVARPGDEALRRRAVVVLSRHRAEGAALALAKLVADPLLAADAAGALGRSRSPAARAALAALARDTKSPLARRLGVRALLLRALVHGVDADAALDAARALAQSPDPADRALFIQTHVALGALSVEHGLAERDAPARAAAIMGALAHLDARACRALADRRAVETDRDVRTLLAVGFGCDDGAEGVSSAELWARARDGGPDAPLALMGLATRAHDRDDGEIASWFDAGDVRVRSHVARGLGASARSDAVGRLARALLYEAEPSVRRVLVRALAARGGADVPSGREALGAIAEWDVEDDLRALADSALRGGSVAPPSRPAETAWLKLQSQEGRSGGPTLAAVERSDGLAIPIMFDADGFAVVPALPPGAIQLVLAPRLPSLQPSGVR